MTDERTIHEVIEDLHKAHMRNIDAVMRRTRNACFDALAELCEDFAAAGQDALACARSIRTIQRRLDLIDDAAQAGVAPQLPSNVIRPRFGRKEGQDVPYPDA